eukprot:3108460-Lingulodinium_polyedra.AAC.1
MPQPCRGHPATIPSPFREHAAPTRRPLHHVFCVPQNTNWEREPYSRGRHTLRTRGVHPNAATLRR